MTPEKLELWAEWVRENAGEGFAFSFRGQNLSPTEFAHSLDRLAAKMREPDGAAEVVVTKHSPGGRFTGVVGERPYIFLDSLEVDDE